MEQIVQEAENLVVNEGKTYPEYVPLSGVVEFLDSVNELLFGGSGNTDGIISVQSPGGTAALRHSAEFCRNILSYENVLLPFNSPEFFNLVFTSAGFKENKIHNYKLWDFTENKIGLFGADKYDLSRAEKNSIIILKTSMQLSRFEWKTLSRIVKKMELFPIFWTDKLGLISGNISEDSYPLNLFRAKKIEYLCCLSFSQNMKLYSERVGCLILHSNNQNVEFCQNILNQLILIAIPLYTIGPKFGARIVAKILQTPDLFQRWKFFLQKSAAAHDKSVINFGSSNISHTIILNEIQNEIQNEIIERNLFEPNYSMKYTF